MPKVQYTGEATRRKILKKHFQAVGVEDQDDVEFDKSNDFQQEVSEAAAKHLTTRDTFKLVKGDADASSGAGASVETGTDAPRTRKQASEGSPPKVTS